MPRNQPEPQTRGGGVISLSRLQNPSAGNSASQERGFDPEMPSGSGRHGLPQLPDVRFTWNSVPPDKLRVVKKFRVWPLQFKVGATYDRHDEKLSFEFSCKDQIIKGRLLLNTANQTIHYKKFFPLNNGMQIALNASCRYDSLMKPDIAPDYRIGFGLEFGSNNFSLVGNSFDVRHKVHITRGLVAEVCGNLRIPLPDAQFGSDGSMTLGNGEFHIHVEQLNAIIRL